MKNNLLIFLLLCHVMFAFAQNGTVRGFVYDKESGEPVMFCNVIIEDLLMGTSTDVNGFFNISKVPVGQHKLMVTSLAMIP